MTQAKGSIVAPNETWDRVSSISPPGLQRTLLKLFEQAEQSGLERLPTSVARRVRNDVWEICISGPEGRYTLRIVSEANGKPPKPINRNDGQIGIPSKLKSIARDQDR